MLENVTLIFSYFGDNCSGVISSALNENLQIHLQSESEFRNICLSVSKSDENSLQSLLLYRISPYVIFIIAVTNTLVCIVLSRATMITPTNIILLAIAVSDMFTGLFPFPIYVMYNWSTYSSLFTENTYLAYLSFYLTTIFPTTFHTVSVWLTITLAFQRVIYVKFATLVTQFCTNKISVITTTFILFLAIFMHSVNFTYSFERYYQVCSSNQAKYISEKTFPNDFQWKNYSHFGQMMKCSRFTDSVLFWYNSLRIVLLHVVPCVLLTILTAVILIVLKQKSDLSKRLLATKNNRKSSAAEETVELSIYRKKPTPHEHTPVRSRCSKDTSSSTSKMLVVVLLIFLSVEIPMGMVITLYVILRFLGASGRDKLWYDTTNICNFLILISYPFNFVIYCIMSKKFRDTFKETLCPNRIYNIISSSNIE